ncbi:restriction endonuclease [Candidatus Uhrbacteria bacterium]|nr:restriction endonuclease [Candidatus Uhrbacteria bacterium]
MDNQTALALRGFFDDEFSDLISEKLEKGHSLSKFKVNPFTLIALASGVLGEATPENMAKALLYPHVFGTSVTTTFGDKMQKLCILHLGAQASSTPGMDIEFVDKVDGKKILLQLKSGPNTINAGDVAPILEDFRSAHRLLLQNRASDLPVFAIGVVYGRKEMLSGHYRKILAQNVGGQMEIPVYIGKDFWWRMTGEEGFYESMIRIFVEVFGEKNFQALLEDDLKRLSSEINGSYFKDAKLDPSLF